MIRSTSLMLVVIAGLAFAGCHSPYYADQGALAGGLGGAGLGAIIGSASGHAGAGAAIGGVAGALTRGAVGGAPDDIDGSKRASPQPARPGRSSSRPALPPSSSPIHTTAPATIAPTTARKWLGASPW